MQQQLQFTIASVPLGGDLQLLMQSLYSCQHIILLKLIRFLAKLTGDLHSKPSLLHYTHAKQSVVTWQTS